MTTPEERLDALLLRHLDGALDETARSELEKRLRADPAVAERLAWLAADQVELCRLLKRTAVADQAERVSGQRTDPSTRDFPVRPFTQRPYARRWAVAGALAGAAVLLAAVVLWSFRPGLQLESGRVAVNGVETSRLREGERFTVAGNEPAVLRLADGSRVQLEVASVAVVRGSADGARQLFELAQGAGQFRVEKGGGAFRVETPSGKVTVLGTEFTVELQPGSTRGESAMRDRTAWTLVVAVMVGSVQVDWSGGRVTLDAGRQQAFAAEGGDRGDEARRPAKESKERKVEGERREGKEGDKERGERVTLTGLVEATFGEVPGEGGRMVKGVTAVKLVTDGATYPVKLDRNGKKLGQSFDGQETTVHGALFRQETGTLLVVTGIPALGGDREKAAREQRREGGVKDGEGERRAPAVRNGDREGEGAPKLRDGEGDRKGIKVRQLEGGEKEGDGVVRRLREGGARDGEGERRVPEARDGDREGEGRALRLRDGEGDRKETTVRRREGGEKEGDGAVRRREGGDGDREGGERQKATDATF